MNAGELAQRLADRAEEVARFLFPDGKKAGNEWKLGGTSGEAGQSMSIRIKGDKAGVWADFATGETGDLLDAWQARFGLSVVDAMKEAKRHLGIHDTLPEKPVKKVYQTPNKPKCNAPKAGVKEWLTGRGLAQQTIDAFKIGEYQRQDKTYAVFPFIRAGVLINVKHRNIADKRDMRQEGGAEPCLFGWDLIGPKERTVIICEGEIDCMVLHQWGFAALSVNAGAGNHQWIENDWDRLDRFSEIIVCFDNDEAGQKGAKEVIHRLGIERCKNLVLPAKDPNDWLLAGASGEDFMHEMRKAKPLDPEEMRSIADYKNEVLARFYPAESDKKAPRLKIDRPEDWFEFRPSEVSVWTGINGHGKSLLLSQVQLGLMEQGETFMVFSGEMKPGAILARMTKQATGLDKPSRKYIEAVCTWLAEKCWVFDLLGAAKLDRLLEVFSYASRRYRVSHFVIDSLMMTDVPDDGPKAHTAQKEAIAKICAFARSHDVHVHLVAHPRKQQDEKSAPGKMDVMGSGHITNAVDNVFSVWRAQKDNAAPDDSEDARLELHKQREKGKQFKRLSLWFDLPSQQYRTSPRRYPLSFVPFESTPEVA